MLPQIIGKTKKVEFPEYGCTVHLSPMSVGTQIDLDEWRTECMGEIAITVSVEADRRRDAALGAVLSSEEHNQFILLQERQRDIRGYEAKLEATNNRSDVEVAEQAPAPLSDEDLEFVSDVEARVRAHDPQIGILYTRQTNAYARFRLGQIAAVLGSIEQDNNLYVPESFLDARRWAESLPVDMATRLIDEVDKFIRVTPGERRDLDSPSISQTNPPVTTATS